MNSVSHIHLGLKFSRESSSKLLEFICQSPTPGKGGSRHKNLCMARVLSFLNKVFQ